MLDGSSIAFFKAKAGERGYQTLINQALHQTMAGESMESTPRRVIREEPELIAAHDRRSDSLDLHRCVGPLQASRSTS